MCFLCLEALGKREPPKRVALLFKKPLPAPFWGRFETGRFETTVLGAGLTDGFLAVLDLGVLGRVLHIAFLAVLKITVPGRSYT